MEVLLQTRWKSGEKIFPIKNRYVIDSRTLFPRSNLKTCFRHSDKKEKKKKRKEKSEYLANFFHP